MMQPEQVANAIAIACKAAGAGRYNRGLAVGVVVGVVATLVVTAANAPSKTPSQTVKHPSTDYATVPYGVSRFSYY